MENEHWLIVGLGNPGPIHEKQRHNVGFRVIDELKKEVAVAQSQNRMLSELTIGAYEKRKVYLQKPLEYMNLSGKSVRQVVAFFKIDIARIIVLHDDLDLPFGKVKIKIGGSDGGHNGLKSVTQVIGEGYIRVRVGIGRPAHDREEVVRYVLSPFSVEEEKDLARVLQKAKEATLSTLIDGVGTAMNKFNGIPG